MSSMPASDQTPMKVRHFGNTANNAYFNVRLLDQFTNLESVLPIQMYGLRHAISAPAWEAIEFDVPSVEWVDTPDWSPIPEAVTVNRHFAGMDPVSALGSNDDATSAGVSGFARFTTSLRTRLFGPLRGQRWAQPLIDIRDRQSLAGRPTISEAADAINLLYGSGSLYSSQPQQNATRTVCFEHGTVRWIADGDRDLAAYRQAYRKQVEQAQHLWVTNLDPRTLEVAEDVAPGRWSALPHPYVPDPRVPFAESVSRREELLRQTGSDALVLLPASQNWSKHHDKGSMRALLAFVELRRKGVNVGLVAVEWGLQLAESKQFLEQAGVGDNVAWMPPMARITLQRLMANVDVVWDQFGLEVFGALALRAVEQGTPLVSRGLAPMGETLIGGPVPWQQAATTDGIVRETVAVLEDMSRCGRATVVAETRARYRGWLLERHSAEMTAVLQRDVYTSMLEGSFEPGSAAPDQWAKYLDTALDRTNE